MLSKKALRRLTTLIHFMEKLPREAAKHFSMTMWIAHYGDHSHDFGEFIRPRDPMTCGTTACALGWAATIPSFRRAGLKVEAVAWDGQCDHSNNTYRGMQFFDITSGDFLALFGGSTPVSTPKQWARHARRFMRLHGVRVPAAA